MSERRIGMALDFSPSSNYALQWAIDNHLKDGDKLILVMVVRKTDQLEQLWGGHGSPLIPYLEFCNPDGMKRYNVTVSPDVAYFMRKLRGSKRVEIVGKVYYGNPKQKILDAVADLSLDELCLGSVRGLGGLKKEFLGSVSDFVMNNAPCPVTIVRLPAEDAAKSR